MRLKVGDKVKFLNDIGGGTITKIENNLAYVLNEDGFEIPASTAELVPDASYAEESKAEENKKEVAQPEKPVVKKIEQIEVKEKYNTILSIVPVSTDKISISDLNVYLVNDGNFYLLYNLFAKIGDKYQLIKGGQASPNVRVKIGTYSQSDITKWSQVQVQVLYSGKGTYQPIEPINRSINLSGVRFYKESTYAQGEYAKSKSIDFDLKGNVNPVEYEQEIDLEKVVKEKEKREPVLVHKSPKPKADIIEIDLHIHELVDNHNGLSNSEIVNIQMDKFRSELLKALSSYIKRIVFIHGVGNGILKMELRKELERKYPKLSYQDASFKEYGFGATMVNLR